MSKTATEERKLLTMRDLVQLTGATRKTIRSWVRKGRFPKPLPLGAGKLWWNAEAVERALAGRTASGGKEKGVD